LPDGAPSQINRVIWRPLADGRVNQSWEISRDGGATWTFVFDDIYSRVDRAQ